MHEKYLFLNQKKFLTDRRNKMRLFNQLLLNQLQYLFISNFTNLIIPQNAAQDAQILHSLTIIIESDVIKKIVTYYYSLILCHYSIDQF